MLIVRYLRLLEIIEYLLVQNVVTSKRYIHSYNCYSGNNIVASRDIFYRDVKLFKKQEIVNGMIEDISCSLGVPRPALHIKASGKGLFYGNIHITLLDGSLLSGISQVNHFFDLFF